MDNKMKTTGILLVVISVFSFFLIADSFAQQGRGTPDSRIYDPKTVTKISGEVVSVDKITPRKGMSYGVHLMVKTENETVSVHLGPGWFIENQNIKIEPKDKIEVRGSKITLEGKTTIIAAEVMKGDKTLKLRDENGFPVWSGGKRR